MQFFYFIKHFVANRVFDPARKRPLPEAVACLGVVTSASGAALHDVLEVTGRRSPATPILLAATRVQGDGADVEIVAALAALAIRPEVELILLVRGGGSLEDLQAFNSEALARAIADSPVPILCGVGHEVDVTIADLVADRRAPTPSAAAELALPDRAALRAGVVSDWRRLTQTVRSFFAGRLAELERQGDALKALAPTARLAAQRARWLGAARALERGGVARIERSRAQLFALAGRLDSLSPLGVLDRGYALVRRTRDGAIVRRDDQVPPGERIAIRLAEAEVEAVVDLAQPLGKSRNPL